jgi:hypothetical protein
MKTIKLTEFWTVDGVLDEKGRPRQFDTPEEAAQHGEPRRHGAQKDFVLTDARYAGYIGGLGSGKTFAGVARGLAFSQQPKPPGTLHGARGLCGAISYPVLRDVVIPVFHELIEGTGLMGPHGYSKSEKKATLKNGAEILFRSLDNPNSIRGVELSWFFIDEGRHLSREAFDILNGRLRQPGFAHAGWVASTPNGYDWMWSLLHPDSPDQYEGAEFFEASTYDNRRHLPAQYIDELDATYEGKWHEQEVLGRFVGLMTGSALPSWRPEVGLADLEYDPDLPLFSTWDFGIGDLGVCEFAQIATTERRMPDGSKQYVPELRVLDLIESQDWSIDEWALAFESKLADRFGGHRPVRSWGDPAGKQRSMVTGTSVIDALASKGISVGAARKQNHDLGLLILDNMMAGGRVKVDRRHCTRLSAAASTHHFPTDENGNRMSNTPVHDWTSHFIDALRYLATSELSLHFNQSAPPRPAQPGAGTMGALMAELTRKPESWLGVPQTKTGLWVPGTLGVPNG